MTCGVGRRHGLDPVFLGLWYRPVATAPIQPLAWEPPCAAGSALKSKKNLININPLGFFVFLGPLPWHMEVPRLGVESEL